MKVIAMLLAMLSLSGCYSTNMPVKHLDPKIKMYNYAPFKAPSFIGMFVENYNEVYSNE